MNNEYVEKKYEVLRKVSVWALSLKLELQKKKS